MGIGVKEFARCLKSTKTIFKYYSLILMMLFSSLVQLSMLNSQPAYAASAQSYLQTKVFDTTNGNAYSNSVTTDYQNNVYVAGDFSGTVIFDGVGGSDSHTSSDDSTTSFLTKYNSSGDYVWTRTVDCTSGNASSNHVNTDIDGNIYVAGNYTGTVAFDGVGGIDIQTNDNGTNNPYITKYDSDGIYQWANVIDSTNESISDSVAIDADGGVYIDGFFSGTATFDGTDGSDVRSTVDHNSFLTKFDSDGSYAWTKTIDDTAGAAYGNGVAIDKTGNIYTTGYFYNTVIFDGVGGSDIQSSPTSDNSYLTKYDSNGNYTNTRTFDATNGGVRVYGITIDDNDNIYLNGTFYDTVIFDGMGGNDSKTSSTTSDFITKFNADGSYGWTNTLDATDGSAYIYNIAVNNNGELYATGDYYGTVIFDGIGGSDSYTGTNEIDNSFFTKFDINGDYLWTKTFDNSEGWSYNNDIAIDENDNIYIVGYFLGTVVFDGVGGTDSITSSISGDSFLAIYRTIPPIAPPASPTHPNPTATVKESVVDDSVFIATSDAVIINESTDGGTIAPTTTPEISIKTDSPTPKDDSKPAYYSGWWNTFIGIVGLGVLFIVVILIIKLLPKKPL